MILLFVAIVTQLVTHMELKLFTIEGHQSSTLMLCRVHVVRSFAFCAISLFVLFSFEHCIVLPSSIYCFWIPFCYLQSFPTFMLLPVIDVKHFFELSTLFNAFLWPLTSYYCEYILTFLKIINSSLTDLVIIVFKSNVRVYSPLSSIRNLPFSLFLI